MKINFSQTSILEIGTSYGFQDEEILLPLTAIDLHDVSAVSIKINFDETALEFIRVENAAADFSYSQNNGIITFGWFDVTLLNPINIENGKLLDLIFTVKNGSSSVSFIKEECEISNSSGQEIEVDYRDGSINLITSLVNNDNQNFSFKLHQNYPNPFNPTTSIQYAVGNPPAGRAGKQFVLLKVYDVLGNEITTLVNEEKPAGNYSINFNSSGLSSGVYFYELRTSSHSVKKKMILLR